ncbi:MAG: class II aldolase/adducin family protein [Spirochaetales bacterium]|nr:class II aldolase/adducin family protein [Spirochaetales bacterium]
MDLQQAREIVCQAGLKLAEEGLVARTWGNISCRVDEKSFVITPSGRNYEDLSPGDIVQVQIEDLEWSGNVKPSSEKGLHAEVYKLDDSAGAVIHTHQQNASAVAAARREIPLGELPEIDEETVGLIGPVVPCAGYGLPGTRKLKTASASALKESGSKAALMANHGAVCYGKTMDEAFDVATALEKVCTLFVKNEFLKLSGESEFTLQKMHDYYLKTKEGRK